MPRKAPAAGRVLSSGRSAAAGTSCPAAAAARGVFSAAGGPSGAAAKVATLSGSMVSEDEEEPLAAPRWLGETLAPCRPAVRARVVNRQVSSGVSTRSRRWEASARAPEDGKRASRRDAFPCGREGGAPAVPAGRSSARIDMGSATRRPWGKGSRARTSRRGRSVGGCNGVTFSMPTTSRLHYRNRGTGLRMVLTYFSAWGLHRNLPWGLVRRHRDLFTRAPGSPRPPSPANQRRTPCQIWDRCRSCSVRAACCGA